MFAAAKNILLRDRAAQDQFFGGGKADSKGDGASGSFLDLEIYVHLVGSARDGRRIDIDLGKIRQSIQALFGFLYLVAVVIGAFELPHFAADDFVAAAAVARNVDAAHVHPASRIDHDGQSDTLGRLVQLRHCVGIGKGIALVSQPVGDALGAFRKLLARKSLSRFQLDHGAQFGLGQQHDAAELDLRYGVFFTFGNVDRDVDVFLVRRNRHLRRIDVELEIAAVQVM